MRRSNRSFPFFARNWISNHSCDARRAGHTFSPRSSPDSLLPPRLCRAAIAPARAQKFGIEMPAGHFNVRNRAKPHVRSAANFEDEVGTLPLAEYGRSFVWEGMRACRACDSDRFRTSRRRQWRLRREQDLTEAEAYVRHARIPVNGNLFGNISTRRCYSTAHDPCSA